MTSTISGGCVGELPVAIVLCIHFMQSPSTLCKTINMQHTRTARLPYITAVQHSCRVVYMQACCSSPSRPFATRAPRSALPDAAAAAVKRLPPT